MDYKEIKEKEAALFSLAREREELLYETEGEYTQEVEDIDNEIAGIIDELATEGTDTLGRWHVSVENELKTLKAEKAAIDRRIKSSMNTIDFIKDTITNLLFITGKEQIKGTLYSYKRTKSTTTKVDSEMLESKYQAKVESALHSAGIIPDYVTVKLDAKVSLVPEGADLPDLFIVNEKDTVRFTKPRKSE